MNPTIVDRDDVKLPALEQPVESPTYASVLLAPAASSVSSDKPAGVVTNLQSPPKVETPFKTVTKREKKNPSGSNSPKAVQSPRERKTKPHTAPVIPALPASIVTVPAVSPTNAPPVIPAPRKKREKSSKVPNVVNLPAPNPAPIPVVDQAPAPLANAPAAPAPRPDPALLREEWLMKLSLLSRKNTVTGLYHEPVYITEELKQAKTLCDALKYKDLSKVSLNFLKYFLHVSRVEISDTPLEIDLAKKYNLPFMISYDVLSSHPHSRISRHCVDKALLALAISCCDKNGCKEINDYFGSNRHRNLMLCFEKASKTVFGCSPPVVYSWHRPLITSKDFVSYSPLLRITPSSRPTKNSVVIVQDLYNMTPQELLTELGQSGAPVALICVMIYDQRVLAGITLDESVYYQSSETGLFTCFPGKDEPSWIPSPPNDFWVRQTSFRLDKYRIAVWSFHRTIGAHSLFQVNFVENMDLVTEELSAPLPPSALLIRKPYPSPLTAYDRVVDYFTGTHSDLIVFIPAIEKFQGTMTGKTRQVYQISQVTSSVEQLLSVSKYATFWATVPYDRQVVLQDTVTFLTWQGFDRDVSLLNKASTLFGTALGAFKTLKNKMLPAATWWDRKNLPGNVMYGVSFVTALFVLWRCRSPIASLMRLAITRKYKPQQISLTHQFLSSRIASTASCVGASLGDYVMSSLSPMIEEPLKRLIPGGALLIGITEAQATYDHPDLIVALDNRPFVNACLATMFKCFLHVTLNKFHPMVHSCWNVAAMLDHRLHYDTEVTTSQLIVDTIAHAGLALTCGYITNLLPSMIQRFVSAAGVGNIIMTLSVQYLLMSKELKLPFAEMRAESWFYNSFHSWLLKVSKWYMDRVGAPTGTGSSLSHFGYVGHVTPSRLESWHDAVSNGKQQEFDLEVPLLLSLEEAFVPSQLNVGIYDDVYDYKEKAVGQFIICSSPAIFQRPVGKNHFRMALTLRNHAPVPQLARCEAEGSFSREPPCTIKGFSGSPCPIFYKWKNLLKNISPLLKKRVAETVKEDSELQECWKMRRSDWIVHFTSAAKRARAKEAVDLRSEGTILPKSTIFLKSDEVLAPKDLGNGVFGIKARLVKAVHPTIQAAACVEIDRAMKLLKNVFLEPFCFQNGWLVNFAIGSGKNGKDLSNWFTEQQHWVSLSEKRASFIFAGDDTFFIIKENGTLKYGEVDFAKYDRTQGVHALSFECSILSILLCSPEMISNLMIATLSPSIYEDKSIEFLEKIYMAAQRATGGPDTTLGNSINNAFTTWGLFLSAQVDVATLPQEQLLYGFESKFKVSSDFVGVTFLKGSWFPSGQSFVWLPLPSQAIKLGKLLTDPRLIYPNDAPRIAWRKAAYALSQGVGNIPFSYPILGDLLKFYATKGVANDLKLKDNLYRAEADVEDVDLDCVHQFFYERYGITEEEIISLRATFDSLSEEELPILLPSSPIWTKLWFDYV